MGTFARLTWLTTWVAVVATIVGLLVLLGYSFSEVLANPGISLEDGYWVGRLPWISIGVDLTVIAATLVAVFGTISALLSRPRTGLIAVLPLTVVGFFWFVATYDHPSGGPCVGCPAPTPDPFAYAYSLPAGTAVLLLVPALVVAVIAFATRPQSGETRSEFAT